MIKTIATLIGLLVALALNPRWLMEHATRKIDRRAPSGVAQADWEAATGMPTEEPGIWLGRLERGLSFAAIQFELPLIIVGWLGFKVASKWQVWQSVIRVPDALPDAPPLDYLRATRAVGSWMAMRVLIGTAGNILAGFLGVLVVWGVVWMFG